MENGEHQRCLLVRSERAYECRVLGYIIGQLQDYNALFCRQKKQSHSTGIIIQNRRKVIIREKSDACFAPLQLCTTLFEAEYQQIWYINRFWISTVRQQLRSRPKPLLPDRLQTSTDSID